MCTERYIAFNCTEANLFSGFMQVFQVYSNNVSKAKVIPPVCACA